MLFEDDLYREPWMEAPPSAIATTQIPLPITFQPVERDDLPEGTICVGTFLNGKLISRFLVPDMAALERIRRIVGEGAILLMEAREKDGGIDARLAVLVSYARARAEAEAARQSDEPWKASVPEAESWQDEGTEDVPADALVPLPIGNIVRVPGDRRHPDDLAAETFDLMHKVATGQTEEVVDRLLRGL